MAEKNEELKDLLNVPAATEPAPAEPPATPPVAEAAPAEPTPEPAPSDPVQTHLDAFVASFPEGTEETRRKYVNHVGPFLRWALSEYGDFAAVSPDAPTRYYEEVKGWNLDAGQHNIAQAAIKCFARYALSAGMSLAPFNYPETHRVPRKKKPRVQTHEDSNEPIYQMDRDGNVIELPTMSTPNPGFGASSAMSKPRPVARNTVANRNPIATMMPASGRLRISKISDGSDGTPAGRAKIIGEYSATEMGRYPDPVSFIQNVIRKAYGPLPGQPDACYIYEQINEWGQTVPPAHEVVVAAPLPGAEGPGITMSAPALAAQNRVSVEQEVIRIVREKEEENRRLNDKLMEEVAKARNENRSMDPLMMIMLMERYKPKPIDVSEITQAVRAANPQPPKRDNPPPMPLSALPMPVHQSDNTETVADILKSVLDKTLNRELAPPPAATAADPLNSMLTLMQTMKAAGLIPEPRNHEAEALREELREIRRQMAEGSKSKDLMSSLNELATLKGFLEKMDSGGGSGPSALELFMENLPQIGEAAAKVISSAAQLKTIQPPQLPPKAGVSQPPSGNVVAGRPPLPTEARNALNAVRDAEPDDEQSIVNGLFALVAALGGGDPFWQKQAEQVAHLLKEVTTKGELQALVTNVFQMCGARDCVKTPVIQKVTDTLFRNYSVIIGAIGGDANKKLIDDALEMSAEDEDEDDEEESDEDDDTDDEPEDEDETVE